MSPASLPKMFMSEREGWSEITRIHPSVAKVFATVVLPLSIVPPLMYAYAEVMYPGRIFPLSRPPLTAGDLFINGLVFFVVEVAMVSFMATLIRQFAESAGTYASYEDAYTLAAIAPVPIWLASLALFVPSLAFAMVVLAFAWVGSVALIRHGTRPLLHIEDDRKAHHVASMIVWGGVLAWFSLMIVAAGALSFLLSWWK